MEDAAQEIRGLRFFDDGRILAVSGVLFKYGVWDLSQNRKLSEIAPSQSVFATLVK